MSNTTHVSPYAAAKLVNKARAEAGIEGNIPPQMMYNYTTARVRAGKTAFIAYDPEKGIELKALEEWTKKYIAKKTAVVETVTA